MAEYLIQDTTLIELANAVRTKTGKADILTPNEMVSNLNTIPERVESDLSVSGATITVPAGNYKSQAIKSVKSAEQASPSISVDSNGLITASVTQTEGYVGEGTKSATKQLTVQDAQTITPGTSNKTITSGRYLTGTQTIVGDADLIPENIKKGVNIFGVDGTCESSSLSFSIVGGTTQPSNPANNTVWVNTSTAISSWVFSATTPSSPAEGMVWFLTGTASNVAFNALNKNNIMVYPLSTKQYVSGAWVDKIVSSYKNGAWVSWWDGYLYKNGDECKNFTGGWGLSGASTRGSTSIKIGEDPWRFDVNSTAYTNKGINLTGKTTLQAYFTTVNAGKSRGYIYLDVYRDGTRVARKTVANNTTFSNAWSSLDISTLPSNGDYIVKINAYYHSSAENYLINATFSQVRCT